MKWFSISSNKNDYSENIQALYAKAQNILDDHGSPDCLFVFSTDDFIGELKQSYETMKRIFEPKEIIGATTSDIMGGQMDSEGTPGMNLLLLYLEDEQLDILELDHQGYDEKIANLCKKMDDEQSNVMMLLSAPDELSTYRIVLNRIREYKKSLPLIGGILSSKKMSPEYAVFHNKNWDCKHLLVTLSGKFEFKNILLPSCRMIGDPVFITKKSGNTIYELDGRPAFEVLERLYSKMYGKDDEAFRHSLFAGLYPKTSSDIRFDQSKILVRNIMDTDPDSGTITIGDDLEKTNILQFCLRDPRFAEDEMNKILSKVSNDVGPERIIGIAGFNCLGRGQFLFKEEAREKTLIDTYFPKSNVLGMVCNGEFANLDQNPEIYSYTNSLGLFIKK